jgi:hypothetical protein
MKGTCASEGAGERVKEHVGYTIGASPHLLELDALAPVDVLLLLEGVRVEVLLQLLVAEVDAQLLERVLLEDLEAEDVEDADEPPARVVAGVGVPHGVVDALHEPVEEHSVHRLREAVRRLQGLLRLVQDPVLLPAHLDGALAQARRELVGVDAEQARGVLEPRAARGRDDGALVAVGVVRDVAEVQNGASEPEELVHLLLGEAQLAQGERDVVEVRRVVDAADGLAAGLVEVPALATS